jgi:hypothetical protein
MVRVLCIILLGALLSATLLATGYEATPVFLGGVELPAFEPRAESASLEANQALGGGFNYSAAANGVLVQRYVFDTQLKLYTGYDVLFEPNLDRDTYLLTFRPLSIGVDEFAARLANLPLDPGNNPRQWTFQAPARYLQPRQATALETIAVDLSTANQRVGDQITDQITMMRGPKWVALALEYQPRWKSPQPAAAPGEAGIFDPAKDARMTLLEPRVRIDGNSAWQHSPVTWYVANGRELVWFYLPGRGRYILSIFAHADLGFVKAGEVQGDSASFTSEGEVITLENSMPIASGYAPHSLYVLHQPEYSPASADQKDRFEYGSLSPDEIKPVAAN